MLPTVHGENCISPSVATGLMMNWALASHELADIGQHGLVLLQPLAHCTIIKVN